MGNLLSSSKQYVLRDRIGIGCYGEVFRADDTKNKKRVAIKKLFTHVLNHDKLRECLEAEREIMMDGHQNIVELLDFYIDEDDNRYCVVMELCEGGDLESYIAKRGKLPEATAVKFVLQLACGLDCMHKRGFMHRDFKAANILLSSLSDDATVLIADFGFCRILKDRELAMTYCGTPFYMAPEVLKMGEYGFKADMYSLGVIMFHMLTGGQLPYRGRNEIEMLYGILHAPFSPCPEGVSEATWKVTQQLLQPDEHRRPSAEELINILTAVPVDTTSSPGGSDGLPVAVDAAAAAPAVAADADMPPPIANKETAQTVPEDATSSAATPRAATPSPLYRATDALIALFCAILPAVVSGKHISRRKKAIDGVFASESWAALSFFLWLALQARRHYEQTEGSAEDKEALLDFLVTITAIVEKMSIGADRFSPLLPHPLALPTQIYTNFLEEELPEMVAMQTMNYLSLSYQMDKVEEALTVAGGSWRRDDKAWLRLKDVFESCRVVGMTIIL